MGRKILNMMKKVLKALLRILLPLVLFVLLVFVLIIPKLLSDYPCFYNWLRDYLQILGGFRTQYLTLFGTVVSSFVAVMSALMIQKHAQHREEIKKQKEEKDKRDRALSKIREILRNIKTRNDHTTIDIDNWYSNLYELVPALLRAELGNRYVDIKNICKAAEHYNFSIQKEGDSSETSESHFKDYNDTMIQACLDDLRNLIY